MLFFIFISDYKTQIFQHYLEELYHICIQFHFVNHMQTDIQLSLSRSLGHLIITTLLILVLKLYITIF